jgi:hypothetical protein
MFQSLMEIQSYICFFSIVRGERFSDGLFGSYVANGTMDKWLTKLQELDV